MQKGDLFHIPDTKILRFPAILGICVVNDKLECVS